MPISSSLMSLIGIFSFVVVKGVKSSLAEDRLLVELFETRRYNKLSHPVEDFQAETVDVQLGLVFQKVIEVDELHEVFRANVWHRIKWKDYRLKWNLSEYDGLGSLYVPAASIWFPDITLWNNARDDKENVDRLQMEFVRISADGACHWWTSIGQSVSHCPMDITWFPFDDQRCSLIYESWKHESKEVNVTALKPSVDLSYYQNSGEWYLIEIPLIESKTWYHCCETPFSRMTFTVHIRRKVLYYVINLVIPCCLFSIISCITFVLYPTCGERLGVGVTLLLALSVYQTIVNEKLPATCDAVPLLGIYFTFVTVICAISVAITMIVLNMHNRSLSDAAPMPSWAKRLVCNQLAPMLRVKMPRKRHCLATEKRTRAGEDDRQESFVSTDDRVSIRDLDLLCNSGIQLLQKIYKLLQFRMSEDSQERDMAATAEAEIDDWILAAQVIDRVCFLLFTTTLVTGTLTIFLLATFRW